MPRPLRVFICHSSNDKPAVRELYQSLRAEMWIDPWLDEEELYPGQDWNLEIEKAVEAADIIFVCLSGNSVTKDGFAPGYVQREIRIALDYADYKPEGALFVIPIRLEECEIPKRLSRWQYADYFEGQRERAFERLLVSLRRFADAANLDETDSSAPKAVRENTAREALKSAQFVFSEPRQPVSIPATQTLSNGMDFLRVPAGKFLMGNKEDNKLAYRDEMPQHTVDIPYDYWTARFLVTNEQYHFYVEAVGGEHPISDWQNKKNHPVRYVSWNDAMAYCEWLNGAFKAELPAGLVLRLPTEAEWEKAARGVTGYEYPWGNQFDKNKCNSSESEYGDTTPVGAYSPRGDSPYGCADMAGNLWEWTHSLKKNYPYRADDGRENEKTAGARALRGGSFIDYVRDQRSACRGDHIFLSLIHNRGFRVVIAPLLAQ
ncbi:MAG: SUMF1/EgtB/PvdO family nonheme iron enzyme [Anaerolineales bacterium]|nr:SUMF1/EgtB/PvdO family nonheme iron enzyme [Anaerolineales bacterium]